LFVEFPALTDQPARRPRQVHEFDAPIRWITSSNDHSGVFEPLEEAAERDGADIEFAGQVRLTEAVIAKQTREHPPL
jgi:hypothetical protein